MTDEVAPADLVGWPIAPDGISGDAATGFAHTLNTYCHNVNLLRKFGGGTHARNVRRFGHQEFRPGDFRFRRLQRPAGNRRLRQSRLGRNFGSIFRGRPSDGSVPAVLHSQRRGHGGDLPGRRERHHHPARSWATHGRSAARPSLLFAPVHKVPRQRPRGPMPWRICV